MRVVYEPKGRAREYSELACNLYRGCVHGCRYCYAPACMRTTGEKWHARAEARPKVDHAALAQAWAADQIGRASCRERVCLVV